MAISITPNQDMSECAIKKKKPSFSMGSAWDGT